jgi:hypothetical protein
MPVTTLADQHIQLPTGTNSSGDRPTSPTAGSFRFQTTTNAPEYHNGTNWISIGPRDGSSADNPASSGFSLKTDYPSLTSGYYWIKSAIMPNALSMYCDMTEDGGGYDFYEITGGIDVNSYTATNSGTALGLDLWLPRSKYHWRAATTFVRTVLGKTGADYHKYFNTTQVYRLYAGPGAGGAGGYTGQIMRDPAYYGSGTWDWRVKDGGRWWIRDTIASPYPEPSGDYTFGQFLGGMSVSSSYRIPEPYNLEDLNFNDGTSGYQTLTTYLVSTNAKP